MKTKLSILIVLALIFSGCEDILSPASENNRELTDIYDDAAFAEGLLLNGYLRLPVNGYSFNDVATDDAVSNDNTNNYRLMATGKWSALNNPVDQWTGAYASIQYLNTILAETDKVNWATTGDNVNEMFNDRAKGEAYGLRAIFMYYLLQAHAGYGSGGELLGVPIITEPLTSESDFSIPRNTFEECIQQIYSDIALAESYLPLDFEDVADSMLIPEKYRSITTLSDYNRVFGEFNRQRLTRRIIKGYKAMASLLAASPAYSEGSTVTWADAANHAGEVLDLIGGINGLAQRGNTWYSRANASEINGLALGSNPSEILWRTNVSENTDWESDNYPPTLYGKGRVNPTQNLVDAFPMANGLPINDPASGYDPSNPYENRDPRLNLYIVVNGAGMGPGNSTIYTSVGRTDDGINNIATSTRTGYYMRKLLREDVNLNPASTTAQKHYRARVRYTELFLAYAEAANEAWGPDGSGIHGFTAREVIAAIRQRAGISQPDTYLQSISGTEQMRALIQNERRLELCFEGFRFWDLRRWKKDISAPAKGVTITADNQYNVSSVENRQYQNYMYYGPLPYNEVLNWGITQNAGW
ncbi:MAG: RagB/SusD family nutrient uptake outer membrane protein [Bacteroidales bacterium]|nr:RagB/SusD family nutrient uptake outer membrane protein [Bacteroidales bacterium]MBN2820761.1 RagB/SusD family nutrient uptake outer membrane protein [Bacteroidales bacterium]